MTDQPTRSYRRRFAMIALGLAVGVAAGLAAVYGIGAMQRNPADASCKPAAEVARRLAPLARGEVAAFPIGSEPKRLPELTFTGAEGKPRALACFQGKTILLNLWATWCVPCRKEM